MTESPYLTTAEAGAIIRTDAEWVARQCKRKAIVSTKVGKEWRIHRDDLETFMRGDNATPASPTRRRRAA